MSARLLLQMALSLFATLALAKTMTPQHVVAPSSGSAESDPWPCKNGNLNRTGTSPHTVQAGIQSGPSWRWVSDYPNDVVRSSPLVDASGDIYISTVTSGRVLKFSKSGAEYWRYSTISKPFDSNSATDHIPEVPALMDGALYVITAQGFVIALDRQTGAERWRVSVGDGAPGDTFSMAAGFGTVVAATTGAARGGGEQRLVALDADGTQLWELLLPSPAYNIMVSLVRCPSGTEVAVFSDSAGNVYKVALQTGQMIWNVTGPAPAGFSTGGAIVGPDDTVYVTSNLGDARDPGLESATAGVVSAYDLLSGTRKWMTNLGALKDANNAAAIGRLNGPTSPLRVVIAVGVNPPGSGVKNMAMSMIVSISGENNDTRLDPLAAWTIAMDAATGSIVWDYELPLWHGLAAGDTASPPHICLPDSSANIAIGGDGTVYVPHEDGRLYAIKDADADDHISPDEVSLWDFGMTFQGSPAIAPGVLAAAPCDGLAAWVTE